MTGRKDANGQAGRDHQHCGAPATLDDRAVSRSRQFDGREIELIDGLPDSTSRNSVETTGSGTGKVSDHAVDMTLATV